LRDAWGTAATAPEGRPRAVGSVVDGFGLEVQPLGLVDDLGGDGGEGGLVGARVVRAEHQFASGLEHHLAVRLRTAAVAAVVCREPGSFESQVHKPICSIAGCRRGSVHSRGSLGAQQRVSGTALAAAAGPVSGAARLNTRFDVL